MRKIITTTFITLDGIMQAPSGPEEDTAGDFKYGGFLNTISSIGCTSGHIPLLLALARNYLPKELVLNALSK